MSWKSLLYMFLGGAVLIGLGIDVGKGILIAPGIALLFATFVVSMNKALNGDAE